MWASDENGAPPKLREVELATFVPKINKYDMPPLRDVNEVRQASVASVRRI